jgi:hypothetical protein
MIGSRATNLAVVTALFAIISGIPFAAGNVFYFETATAQESEETTPLTLTTDNNSVNVIVSWRPQEIEPGQEVTFFVNYQDVRSGQSLTHINHDFVIKDEAGQEVESATGLHTHAGGDIHTVAFNETGNYVLQVTIHGLGISQPFDTTRSGTAQTALVVVPEFPIAPLILAVATGLALVSARLKGWKLA